MGTGERQVTVQRAMQIDPAEVTERIVRFIRYHTDRFQPEGVLLGMSGGIDSAVVGSLAARALGPEKVKALLLPERDSSPDSKADALLEIERLGIQHEEVSLTPMLSAMGVYGLAPLRILGIRRLKAAIVQQQHWAQVEHVREMQRRSVHLRTLPPCPDLDGDSANPSIGLEK